MGNNPREIHLGDLENNLNSEFVVFKKHKFQYLNEKAIFRDENIISNEISRLIFFFRVLKNFKTVHYNFGRTIFSPAYSNPLKRIWFLSNILRSAYNGYQQLMRIIELSLFKLLGKTLTVTYQGDDGRQKKFSLENFEYTFADKVSEEYYPKFSDLEKKFKAKLFNLFMDRIYCVNPDLNWVLPKKTQFLPYAHNVRGFKFIKRDFKRISFLHCPSNSKVKGTNRILEALKSLKRDYDFDLILAEGTSHKKVLELIKENSILIDQLYCGWYGGISVEAMRTGMPSLCYIRNEDLKNIPKEMEKELPIININQDNLQETLYGILSGKFDLQKISTQSFNYAQKWHDRKLISKIINKCVE